MNDSPLQVEVAKQIAERETIEQRKMQDLAVIQKEKELAVAKAERAHSIEQVQPAAARPTI